MVPPQSAAGHQRAAGCRRGSAGLPPPGALHQGDSPWGGWGRVSSPAPARQLALQGVWLGPERWEQRSPPPASFIGSAGGEGSAAPPAPPWPPRTRRAPASESQVGGCLPLFLHGQRVEKGVPVSALAPGLRLEASASPRRLARAAASLLPGGEVGEGPHVPPALSRRTQDVLDVRQAPGWSRAAAPEPPRRVQRGHPGVPRGRQVR